MTTNPDTGRDALGIAWAGTTATTPTDRLEGETDNDWAIRLHAEELCHRMICNTCRIADGYAPRPNGFPEMTALTYRWECPRGHRHNNPGGDRPASCCPSCGWAPDEGGTWTDHGGDDR